MDYGAILTRAWDLTRKNKGLWLLGILAGCAGGQGNPTGTSSYQFSQGGAQGFDPALSRIPEETWILILAGALVIGLVLFVVFLVLGLLGQAGLIAGVAKADDTGSVTLGEAWRGGLPHFWRLLGFTLVIAAVVLVIALAVGLLTVVTFGMLLICLLPLICVLLPLGLIASGYLSLAQNGLVLENLGIFAAFGRGWDLLKRNFWPVVLMALILAGIGLVAGFLFALPLIVAMFPLMLVAMSAPEEFTSWLPVIACGLVYLPVVIILGGILKTYLSAAWTLTFRRLTGAGPVAVSVPAPT